MDTTAMARLSATMLSITHHDAWPKAPNNDRGSCYRRGVCAKHNATNRSKLKIASSVKNKAASKLRVVAGNMPPPKVCSHTACSGQTESAYW